jgi:transposase-like protein
MNCPRCGGFSIVKTGCNGAGTRKFLCKACGRQCVEKPKNSPITGETKTWIDKLLLERIPLAGIARVTGVSARWLQYYVNGKYKQTPRRVEIKKVPRPFNH